MCLLNKCKFKVRFTVVLNIINYMRMLKSILNTTDKTKKPLYIYMYKQTNICAIELNAQSFVNQSLFKSVHIIIRQQHFYSMRLIICLTRFFSPL